MYETRSLVSGSRFHPAREMVDRRIMAEPACQSFPIQRLKTSWPTKLIRTTKIPPDSDHSLAFIDTYRHEISGGRIQNGTC